MNEKISWKEWIGVVTIAVASALTVAWACCLCFGNSYMTGKYEEVGFGRKSFLVAYPNKQFTPGSAVPGIRKEDVCKSGYAKRMRRHLKRSEKMAIYKKYGVAYDTTRYQIDHLIPLSLGGSNEPDNLWPQPIVNNAGYLEKQQVANFFHQKVCSEKMTLQEAQDVMKTNWHAGWHILQEEKHGSAKR